MKVFVEYLNCTTHVVDIENKHVQLMRQKPGRKSVTPIDTPSRTLIIRNNALSTMNTWTPYANIYNRRSNKELNM